MINMTYDPSVDAAYIYLGRGKVERTEQAGPFAYDVDPEGRILGIEILSCKTTLAPGDWIHARAPGTPLPTAAK